jgi:hypothetical protein
MNRYILICDQEGICPFALYRANAEEFRIEDSRINFYIKNTLISSFKSNWVFV